MEIYKIILWKEILFIDLYWFIQMFNLGQNLQHLKCIDSPNETHTE